MTEKPLLLVDVDGVLCPFHFKELPDGCAYLDVEINDTTCQGRYLETITVAFDPRQVARLARLAEAFELHWATIWERFANTKLAPLSGLPVLPVMPIDEGLPSPVPVHLSEVLNGNTTSKLGSVAAYVGERPCAWVDDRIRYDAQEWAEKRSVAGIPTLLVRTEPWDGLTDAQVEQLLTFAAELERAAAIREANLAAVAAQLL